jgi:hypothetical protein
MRERRLTRRRVTQAIVYATDYNQNPGTKAALRNGGYANVPDTDPWGQPWVYSPAFADTGSPATQGEMGVCSTGPARTGTCTFPMTGPGVAVPDGSVGYSSIYGSWAGLPWPTRRLLNVRPHEEARATAPCAAIP